MNSDFSHVNFLWLEAVMLSYSPSRWSLIAADILAVGEISQDEFTRGQDLGKLNNENVLTPKTHSRTPQRMPLLEISVTIGRLTGKHSSTH